MGWMVSGIIALGIGAVHAIPEDIQDIRLEQRWQVLCKLRKV
jgi:hypothetical protein